MIVRRYGKSQNVTLVERHSRLLKSEKVIAALIEKFNTSPAIMRRTLT